MKSVNPATGEILKEFDELSFEGAVSQISRSRSMFIKWKSFSLSKRLEYIKKVGQTLRKNKDKYGKLITLEMGKPITDAISEVEKCGLVCDYYFEYASKFLEDEIIQTEAKKSYVTYEPLGLILGIMPWNYPFWQVARFVIPTLTVGNVCALKHASNVPQCALAIEEVFAESGVPSNVFKTLLISVSTTTKLIEQDHFDGVSLTGSVQAGSNIGKAAGASIKPVVLELGGSDPFIVLEDADIDLASEIGVSSRFLNTGQSCIAAKRFIVHEKVAKQFEEKFVKKVSLLIVGDPMDPKTNIGTLAKPDLAYDLEVQVKDAVDKGAKILIGGKKGKLKSSYMPTVISNTRPNMKIVTEEVFGPVAPIIVAKNDEDAIKIANAGEFGLGASLWTKDLEKAQTLAKEINCGMVFINDFVKSDPRLPFGGIKKSGVGRELSHYGLMQFANIKTVVVK